MTREMVATDEDGIYKNTITFSKACSGFISCITAPQSGTTCTTSLVNSPMTYTNGLYSFTASASQKLIMGGLNCKTWDGFQVIGC